MLPSGEFTILFIACLSGFGVPKSSELQLVALDGFTLASRRGDV